MKSKKIKVKLINNSAILPYRMTPGSSGFDLHAAESVIVPASTLVENRFIRVGHAIVKTGLSIELPANCVGRIGSRSGLSMRSNIEVGAGWIDSDYRGEILIELKNMNSKPFKVRKGDRIAQFFILSLVAVHLEISNLLTSSIRGSKGFGSTGMKKKSWNKL